MKTKPKNYLIATLGYPVSGKTYFSERLSKQNNYFHLSSDKIRLAMFESPKYTPEEHRIVFSFMDYLAGEFLRHGVSVIYDANFNFRKHRKKLQKLANKTKSHYRLVWIKTKENTAINRLGKRAKLTNTKKKEIYRPIDTKVFHILKNEMEIPTRAEKVIEIDGHISFPAQYKHFLKSL